MLWHTPQCTGPLTNKDLSGPNVNLAKVEKACSTPPVKPEMHSHAVSLKRTSDHVTPLLKIFQWFPTLSTKIKNKQSNKQKNSLAPWTCKTWHSPPLFSYITHSNKTNFIPVFLESVILLPPSQGLAVVSYKSISSLSPASLHFPCSLLPSNPLGDLSSEVTPSQTPSLTTEW